MTPEQKDGVQGPPGGMPQAKNDTPQSLGSAVKESAEEFLPRGAKPLYKWCKREWDGIKTGRQLFIILAIAILSVSAWLTHRLDAKEEKAKIASLNSYNAISNSFLLGKIEQNKEDKKTSETTIHDLKADIGRLTTEKTSAENRAALFETIPLQVPGIITNLSNMLSTQPTNQQQLLSLLYSIQALTNSLADVALRPTFDLYINETRITNGTVLSLKESRILRMKIQNTSPITAEQLEVRFGAPSGLAPTNLIANGWIHLPKL